MSPTAKPSRADTPGLDPVDVRARLVWLAKAERLAEDLEALRQRTPYGFARYGGRLRPALDALWASIAEAKTDPEALL